MSTAPIQNGKTIQTEASGGKGSGAAQLELEDDMLLGDEEAGSHFIG